MWRSVLLIILFTGSSCCVAQSLQAGLREGGNGQVSGTPVPSSNPASSTDQTSLDTRKSSAVPRCSNVPVCDNAENQAAPSANSLGSSSSTVGSSSSTEGSFDVKKGFSSYTSISGTHDSASGWSSVLSSSMRYDFNRIFGMELGVPLYLMHNGFDTSVVAKPNTNPPLLTRYNSLGDVVLTLNFAAPNSWSGYRSTITGTGPTGDTSSGISSGRPTLDLNNHFEHSFNRLSPLLEFGVGDSSALINKRVRRPYTTLGPLSHFKAGASFDLFKNFSFQADAYETLPIGDQKVYSHLFVRSANGPIVRVTKEGVRRFRLVRVSTGQGIAEDNGCEGILSTNLGNRLDLSGSYDRSFRQKLDTVTITLGLRLGKTRPKQSQ